MDDASFFKISSICRRRDDTRFFECAFGVDETLVGECSFWQCVFYVDGAHAFAIVVAAIIVLDGARWRDALPEVSVLCRRDAIFSKILALGLDETTFVLLHVHLV